ncbi:hypothetical protein M0811_03641 [Anaeramoeba ignava]|uniref:SP-RING-type domain-containing protein n=1 Tax=Anaeramoeba ignava TaxID=1746090 RepID=A0A9Q0L743_ANAIG|nr:hypothetical protein M0811_03641 [Anaeramoeba ignava]
MTQNLIRSFRARNKTLSSLIQKGITSTSQTAEIFKNENKDTNRLEESYKGLLLLQKDFEYHQNLLSEITELSQIQDFSHESLQGYLETRNSSRNKKDEISQISQQLNEFKTSLRPKSKKNDKNIKNDEIEQSQAMPFSQIGSYNGSQIKDPIMNLNCGHIYSKRDIYQSKRDIYQYIQHGQKKNREIKCPIRGCEKPLSIESLQVPMGIEKIETTQNENQMNIIQNEIDPIKSESENESESEQYESHSIEQTDSIEDSSDY